MPPNEQTPGRGDERDAQGRLTRAGMESVLRRGESVLLGDRVINRLEDLPDEADLAAGDEARTGRARETYLAQREAIDRQLARLPVPAPAPAPAKPSAAEPKPPTEAEPKPEAAPEAEPRSEGDDAPGEGPAFARPFGGRKGGR